MGNLLGRQLSRVLRGSSSANPVRLAEIFQNLPVKLQGITVQAAGTGSHSFFCSPSPGFPRSSQGRRSQYFLGSTPLFAEVGSSLGLEHRLCGWPGLSTRHFKCCFRTEICVDFTARAIPKNPKEMLKLIKEMQENLDVLEKYGVLAEEPGSKGAQVSVTVVSTEKQKNELKQAAATLDDCTAKFKKAIKGKTVHELRALLGEEDDLTEEEKEKIRKENQFIGGREEAKPAPTFSEIVEAFLPKS